MNISDIIFGIHSGVFFSGIFIPFFGNEKQLRNYAKIIPIVMLHWITNNDTCALTLLECFFRKLPPKRTFIGRIMGPIFKLDDNILGKYVKFLFFFLWIFTLIRLFVFSSILKHQ